MQFILGRRPSDWKAREAHDAILKAIEATLKGGEGPPTREATARAVIVSTRSDDGVTLMRR
uniref:Uncharacterized protein n=1 Tax=Paraburkholderia sprentiae WSM5005 TaxID=754502 RepID=A0A1I9YMM0_9BURK